MKIVVAVDADKKPIVKKIRKKDGTTADEAVKNFLNNNI